MRFRFIRYALGIGLFGIALFFISRYPETVARLWQINYYDLAWLLLLSWLVIVLIGIQFKYLIALFGLQLPFREWLGLTVVTTMLNYYLPVRGGMVVRGAYLKTRYDFSFSLYLSLLAVHHLTTLLVVTLLGLILLLISLIKGLEIPYSLLLSIFGSLFLIIFLFYKTIPILTAQLERFSLVKPLCQRFGIGFNYWQQCPYLVKWRLVMLILILNFIWGVRLYSCFWVIETPVDFLKIMLIQVIISVSFIFSLTPGNLGVKEGLTVFTAHLIGITPESALLASLIDRTAALLVIFIGGNIFMPLLMRQQQPNRF